MITSKQGNEFLNQPELICHWGVLNNGGIGWEHTREKKQQKKPHKNMAPFMGCRLLKVTVK